MGQTRIRGKDQKRSVTQRRKSLKARMGLRSSWICSPGAGQAALIINGVPRGGRAFTPSLN